MTTTEDACSLINDEAAEPSLPPFPAAALPPVLRNMGEAIAASLSIEPDLPYICTLSAVSASCGRALLVRSGPDQLIGANLYFLAAAHSAFGKSSVFRLSFLPIRVFQSEQTEQFLHHERPSLMAEQIKLKKQIEGYQRNRRQKRIDPSPDSIKDWIPEPDLDRDEELKKAIARQEEIKILLQPPQMICEDTTSEALALVLRENREQICSLSADADKVFRNIEGLYLSSGYDDNLYVKGYSRDPHIVNRISRERIFLQHPCITIMWLTQSLQLTRLFENEQFRVGGLLPRFLVCGRASKVREIPVDAPSIPVPVNSAYIEIINELLQTFRKSGSDLLIPYSHETYEHFRNYYNSLVPRMNGTDFDIASFIKRWPEQAWRMALVLHAVSLGKKAIEQCIPVKTAEAATQLIEWFAGEQLRELSPVRDVGTLKLYQKIESFLRTCPEQAATGREIQRKFSWGKEQLESVLQKYNHCLDQQIKPPPQRGGLPTKVIRLNGGAGNNGSRAG